MKGGEGNGKKLITILKGLERSCEESRGKTEEIEELLEGVEAKEGRARDSTDKFQSREIRE